MQPVVNICVLILQTAWLYVFEREKKCLIGFEKKHVAGGQFGLS